eukprot:Sdes_comp20984_c0_seq1m19433
MKLLVYYHIVAGFFLAPLIHPIPVCFFQDLDELSQGLQGRSLNPSAVLFDQLFHPNVDIDPSQPTRLCWIPSQPHSLPHLVVGKGSPGGAWASMRHSSLHSLRYFFSLYLCIILVYLCIISLSLSSLISHLSSLPPTSLSQLRLLDGTPSLPI